MLSKNVCKDCWWKDGYGWGNHQEDNWKVDFMSCPEVIGLRENTKVSSPPPKWCPYRFEHAIAAGTDNAK